MADRDWDKELAKVDKQLASLSDEQLLGAPPAAPLTAPPSAGRASAKSQPPVSSGAGSGKATSNATVAAPS